MIKVSKILRAAIPCEFWLFPNGSYLDASPMRHSDIAVDLLTRDKIPQLEEAMKTFFNQSSDQYKNIMLDNFDRFLPKGATNFDGFKVSNYEGKDQVMALYFQGIPKQVSTAVFGEDSPFNDPVSTLMKTQNAIRIFNTNFNAWTLDQTTIRRMQDFIMKKGNWNNPDTLVIEENSTHKYGRVTVETFLTEVKYASQIFIPTAKSA